MKRTPCILLVIVIIMILACSCTDILLGTDEGNDPENVFELFWTDFDLHYSLFEIRKLKWDSIYNVYRPQVSQQTSPHKLRAIFVDMIEYLDDSHTALYTNGMGDYTSGFALGEKAIKEEFSIHLIKSKYTDDLQAVKGEGDMAFGNIKGKDIGYIFLRKMEGKNPEGAIAYVLNELANHEAMIVDIRTNDGGDGGYAKTIAGAFADGEHFISTVQTRNGPRHSDFDAITREYTQRTGSTQYLKPVILLTDRATISAGDYFALNMKAFHHVTIIGDSTAGDLSSKSMRKFLPNGWSYHYSIQMRLLPDGTSLDGIGIVPDIYVKNSKQDIQGSTDKVLDTAIMYLKETYGIE
jgi:carboxyl-terminal processing protease